MRHAPADRAVASGDAAVSLPGLLEAVDKLDSASRSLAALQLSVPERHVHTAWRQALERNLLIFTHVEAGEHFYRFAGPVAD